METTYSYSRDLAKDLAGKFAYWHTNQTTAENAINLYQVYKISDNIHEINNNKINYAIVDRYVSTEKVVATTEDDYGTSYYYRGGVEDNYVNFNGMCWRIVRIVGDGSIKLILEDRDQKCSSSMDRNWFPSNYFYANMVNFGYNIKQGIQEKYFLNYLNKDGKANMFDESLATALKDFQENNFFLFEKDILKSGDWCIGDVAYANKNVDISTVNPLTEEEIMTQQGSLFGGEYYYESSLRFWNKSIKQPTLKCKGTKMEKFGDGLGMYVGTLTADEVLYAGKEGNSNKANSTDYLSQSDGLAWWTLTPSQYINRTNEYVFVVNNGLLESSVNSTNSFRPAITLIPNIKIYSGEGTIENPYNLLY